MYTQPPVGGGRQKPPHRLTARPSATYSGVSQHALSPTPPTAATATATTPPLLHLRQSYASSGHYQSRNSYPRSPASKGSSSCSPPLSAGRSSSLTRSIFAAPVAPSAWTAAATASLPSMASEAGGGGSRFRAAVPPPSLRPQLPRPPSRQASITGAAVSRGSNTHSLHQPSSSHGSHSALLASVRSSHRLQNPDDAFQLGGLIRDADLGAAEARARAAATTLGIDAAAYAAMSPTGRDRAMKLAQRRRLMHSGGGNGNDGSSSIDDGDDVGGGGLAAAAADGSSVRRKRGDRSFLPEDVVTRELKKEQRLEKARLRAERNELVAAEAKMRKEQNNRSRREGQGNQNCGPYAEGGNSNGGAEGQAVISSRADGKTTREGEDGDERRASDGKKLQTEKRNRHATAAADGGNATGHDLESGVGGAANSGPSHQGNSANDSVDSGGNSIRTLPATAMPRASTEAGGTDDDDDVEEGEGPWVSASPTLTGGLRDSCRGRRRRRNRHHHRSSSSANATTDDYEEEEAAAVTPSEDDDDTNAMGSNADTDSSSSSSESDTGSDLEDETPLERRERLEREVILHYAAMFARRTAAVAVIQRGWRCARARLALHHRRQALYQFVYTRQKAAAMCVVGVLRARVQQRRCEAITAAYREDEAERVREERRRLAAVAVIESAAVRWLRHRRQLESLKTVLGICHDDRLRRYAVAAVLVQRWWRVAPSRRAYWALRAVTVAEEQRVRAEADRRCAAATLLQKRARGIAGRRYARSYRISRDAQLADRQRRLRQCTDTVLIALREYTLRLARIARESEEALVAGEEAAAVIQRGWRRALVSRRLAIAAGETRGLRQAAAVVQRAYRQYRAGRELRYLRRLRETVAADRVEAEFRRHRAACTLQRFVSVSVIAARRTREGRADYGRAAFAALAVIQSVGRAAAVRTAVGHEWREAASAARAASARDARLTADSTRLFDAVLSAHRSLFEVYTGLAAHEADIAALRLEARKGLALDGFVVRAQRAVKRWLVRRRTAERLAAWATATDRVLASVACVQRWWRQRLAWKVLQMRLAAAEKQMQSRILMEEVWAAIEDDELAAANERGSKAVTASGHKVNCINVTVYSRSGGGCSLDDDGGALREAQAAWAALYDHE